jgi:sulfonate transport system substrate-binding protein
VPIDDEVTADEQRTADLYLRSALIGTRIDAADFLDRSFNGAVVATGSSKPPSN